MNGTKKFYASIGVMGPLIGLIVMALNTFVFKGAVISEADVTELVNQITAVIAMLTGIWGRWKASSRIG